MTLVSQNGQPRKDCRYSRLILLCNGPQWSGLTQAYTLAENNNKMLVVYGELIKLWGS